MADLAPPKSERPLIIEGRWPAAMSLTEASHYLGISASMGKKLLDKIPAFTYTERGDRYWRKIDLDAYLEDRMKYAVKPKS